MQAAPFPTFARIAAERHEEVVYCSDPTAGLRAIIAIHSTKLGPSLGGCRMYPYANEAAALHDVLRLSRGMTYKAAISNLALGGGKAVIIGDPKTDKTPALWAAFGRAVERLAGRYITAEDVGTAPADMALVRAQTQFAVGSPSELGGSGDPSPMTALGVLSGMRAAAKEAFGSDALSGKKVAVQGCGHVGRLLIGLLVAAGAEVVATDVDQGALAELARTLPAVRVVAPEAILTEPCDILAPCALGGILQGAAIDRLHCRVVAGAANNQLGDEQADGERLAARNIVYAPDYVINAGGLINVSHELRGYDAAAATRDAEAIFDVTGRIFAHGKAHQMVPSAAARALAERRLVDVRKGAEAPAGQALGAPRAFGQKAAAPLLDPSLVAQTSVG